MSYKLVVETVVEVLAAVEKVLAEADEYKDWPVDAVEGGCAAMPVEHVPRSPSSRWTEVSLPPLLLPPPPPPPPPCDCFVVGILAMVEEAART